MSTFPRESTSKSAIGWLGFGGTVVALAFTVHPVHASRIVFWLVVVIGAVGIGIGCTILARGLIARSRSPGTDTGSDEQELLAHDCKRLQAAITGFIDERNRDRPRHASWIPGASRHEEWRLDTAMRYRDELGPWAVRVFDDAVRSGAASDRARGLVEAPAAGQLPSVRDLFRDAALKLARD